MVSLDSVVKEVLVAYDTFINALPSFAGRFVSLFLLVLLVVFYSVFIWKLYRFIARKNILELNLNKYNRSEHAFFTKLLAGIFYFLEYIIILPFLVFLWFTAFTFFLIILSEEGMDVGSILTISAIIIAAIRMTSYYSEDLSKDLAKLLPFTLLAFFVLNFTSFNVEKVIGHITKIPLFFENILIYLGFIILLELILRFFDFIFSFFGLEEVPNVQVQ